MTKDEAAALLGVGVTVSAGDVRRRYEELHNDYQIRLTNAPTPVLKKAYQKNLQDLREACEVLHPGLAVVAAPDLPAAEPVRGADSGAMPRMNRPSASIRESPQAAEPPAAEGGLPRSTLVVGAVAVVMAAAASFFGLVWMQARQAEATLAAKATTQAAEIDALQAKVKSADQLLTTGHLEVCNRSSKTVRIATAAVLYRNPLGTIKSVHTGSYDYPTWDIRPGTRTKLSVLRGQPDDWDGSVTFYSLQLIYEGAEPFILSGLWSDAKDGCVNLYLD